MMRSGFSTSACAAASAAAAIRALLENRPIDEVEIDLPTAGRVKFSLARCDRGEHGVCCGVIKDAGDDPDVTNGIEIQAVVNWSPNPGIDLSGGKGVGVATLPGLPVAVEEAAINPGSRKLILKTVQSVLLDYSLPAGQGLAVKIQVPEGERVALETMNPRLGIMGGISILGTDGLVHPYSAPAFRASLFYELRVAHENGYQTIGLATGKRSGEYLRRRIGDTQGLGVVDVGDELGYPIDQAAKMGFQKVIIGGMIGKLSKLAQGRFQTHVQEGEVDFNFLAELAGLQGALLDLRENVLAARTAHQAQNRLSDAGIAIEPEIARLAASKVFERSRKECDVEIYVFSLSGAVLGNGAMEALHDA